VEMDYEFIQIFKKPGPSRKVPPEIKAASRLTKEEWKEYFAGHWHFGGVRQAGHEARFPEELPRRLIKMFSFVGDTVLDPFQGSGTTVKAALAAARNGVGYEINPEFLEAMPQKIGARDCLPFSRDIQIIKPHKKIEELPEIDYTPAIRDAAARREAPDPPVSPTHLFKVTQIIDERTIALDNGIHLRFLGVRIDQKAETLDYLRSRILGKHVLVKDDRLTDNGTMSAYLYLKNRIFINAHLIKVGLGSPDLSIDHRLKNKFVALYQKTGESHKPHNPGLRRNH
jgi:modification methylase